MNDIDPLDPNRPIAYVRDGVTWLRASAFMSCTRSLSAALAGIKAADPPAQLQNAFNMGRELEPLILQMTEEEYGVEVTGRQEVVRYQITDKYGIEGSLDGRMPGKIVDAKALGDSYTRSMLKGGLPEMGHVGVKYAGQAWAYLKATGEDGFVFACLDKTTLETAGGPVTYFYEYGLDDLADIAQISARKVRNKISAAIAGAEDVLNAPCAPEQEEGQCSFGCPYYFLQTSTEDDMWWMSDAEEAEPTEHDERLIELVRPFAIAKAGLAELKAETDAMKERLDAYLDEHGITEWEGDGYKVTRKDKTKRTLNQKAMMADGIDLDAYREESTYKETRVT